MITFSYTLTDPMGLHARPAAALVKTVRGLTSQVTVTNEKGDKTADGKGLINLMALGCKGGENVTISVFGDKEAQDAAVLRQFCRDNM